MKSLSEFAMSKTNNFREPKNLAMVVTYTFANDESKDITNEFVELLEDLQLKKGSDQSTYELPSSSRNIVPDIEDEINDWINDNSDYINEGSHISIYKIIMLKNSRTGVRNPVIRMKKWEK